jgi:hypothetical protein
MDRKTRRFGLGDLMILTAALGVVMVGERPLWLNRLYGPGWVARLEPFADRLFVAAVLSAFAMPMSLACLAFRLRRPRPRWSRTAIQPGTAAMLACAVIFALRMLELSGSLLSPDVYSFAGWVGGKASPIRFNETSSLVLMRTLDQGGGVGSIGPFGCHGTFVASLAWPSGATVAAVWLVLATSGRWRPEKSWIDRLGRGLGVTWIVISVLAALPA